VTTFLLAVNQSFSNEAVARIHVPSITLIDVTGIYRREPDGLNWFYLPTRTRLFAFTVRYLSRDSVDLEKLHLFAFFLYVLHFCTTPCNQTVRPLFHNMLWEELANNFLIFWHLGAAIATLYYLSFSFPKLSASRWVDIPSEFPILI
jgi:hypothetical protein